MFDLSKEWVPFRDKVEAFVSSFAQNFLKPILQATAKAAVPALEAAGTVVLAAVTEAHANGIDANSHAMIDVGLKAIRDQAPQLEATIATAAVASTVQEFKDTLAKADGTAGTASAP